jgi:hypothetical protein
LDPDDGSIFFHVYSSDCLSSFTHFKLEIISSNLDLISLVQRGSNVLLLFYATNVSPFPSESSGIIC